MGTGSSDAAMVCVRNLVKAYGGKAALRGLSFDIKRGELFGLLGPNGAGKTTTLRILVGLLQPTDGTVEVAGFNVATHATQAKRLLCYVPDRPYVYERLSGRELMRLYGDLYGLGHDSVHAGSDRWLETFALTDKADELIEGYSHGMKQRLVLAASMLVDPDLLILDEPMVGLDPHGSRLLKDLLRERCAAGKTVLMSTHSLHVAEEVCDRVGIMQQGQWVAEGAVADLRARHAGADASLEDVFLRLTAAE